MEKYIGNFVVFNEGVKVDKGFKKCLSIKDVDKSLPCILIGLTNARNIIPNFSILNKKYENEMLWWTFAKNERRVEYDDDIEEFKQFCIKKISEKINYNFMNFLTAKYGEVKNFINYIDSDKKKYYYIDKDKFVFVFDGDTNFYGVSLSTLSFLGIAVDKVLNRIKIGKNNVQVFNFYNIPKSVLKMINDDILLKIFLSVYF